MTTTQAIKEVQTALGLKADGIDGPLTWAAIHKRIVPVAATSAGIPVDLKQFDERSEKNILTLVPKAQEAARLWLKACIDSGLHIKIISGNRTYEEQDLLFAQGRSKSGKIVTKAKGGQSNHNFGVAWDFAIFTRDGAYITSGSDYTKAGKIAEGLGLEWGGSWKGFEDEAHIQLKTGKTMAEMRELIAAGKPVV